ncbi:uncharacterized protein [Dermacentor albipictus]|uniref:uncharacterized protein isoform X1 n=1 Tax=Dermacentor albipictus TaxID=60249 RepID=UPI0038FD2861
MVPFLVLRPCCEVILLYIRHEHDVLRSVVQDTGNIAYEQRVRLVEMVRINLCAVSRLKRRLNQVWVCSLGASGALVLCVTCIGIYLTFVEEFSTSQHLLTIMYGASTGLDFLDIANLSDAMVTEVRRIRYTLQKVATTENMHYVNQLLFLADSLEPGEMALSGDGFFSLRLPLLVSLAGAVITYTVILVQTSESVKK